MNEQIVRNPGPAPGPARPVSIQVRVNVGRIGPTLSRYLTRSLWAPVLISLGGLCVAYLTKSLLGLSDLLINRGVDAGTVGLIALYQLVPALSQILPFAVLIGALAGLGQLRAHSELLVLEVSGVAPRRLIGPVFMFALGAAGIGLVLAVLVAPASRAGLEKTLYRVVGQNPGASLTAGTVHDLGEHRLQAREASPRGDELRGVVVWVPEVGETMFAESASVTPAANGGIELVLRNSVTLLSPLHGGGEISAETFRTILKRPTAGLLDESDALASAGWVELGRLATSADTKLARRASAERHRRIALPLACLLFGLAAVPLALRGRAASPTSGALSGLAVTIAYYGVAQIGNSLLVQEDVPVWLAAWLPDLAGGVLLAVLLLGGRMRGVPPAPERSPWRWRRSSSEGELVGGFILPRYVGGSFLRLAGLCFAALLAGYLLIDVLERLQWFALYEAAPVEMLRFYGARIPLLISRVGPPSMLAAASLTLSLFAMHGELLAMQACGIGLVRAMAPIPILALLAAPVYYVFNDAVVPRANALADHLKVTEIKRGGEEDSPAQLIWYRAGGQFIQAASMATALGTARDVTIYDLDPSGFPTSRIDAPEARHLGGGEWELIGPKRVQITHGGMTLVEAPQRVRLREGIPDLDAMHLSAAALSREIRRAKAGGYDTTALEVDLQARYAAAFAFLLLPLIGVLSGISWKPRSVSRSLMLASLLAIAYLLVGDVSLSLGYGAQLPPAVAAWSPTVALTLICVWIARRSPR